MILSIDPGSDKTGMALVNNDGSLLFKEIVPTKKLEERIGSLLKTESPDVLVMGNGTHHREIRKWMEEVIAKAGKKIPVKLVNEKYTTEMGKEWYWKEHPAKGLQKLIPKGMRTVPVPVDDYVAWILANIYIGKVKPEDIGHKKV